MREGPRSKTEPLIEKVMITGIVIQTIVLTIVVGLTYLVGLRWRFHTWSSSSTSSLTLSFSFSLSLSLSLFFTFLLFVFFFVPFF